MIGKLIYCTRTIAELKQCMEELKRVVAFRKSKLEYRYRSILGVCLSSRRNLCIHPKIDCINPRQAPDIEDLGCEYYEKFSRNQRRPSIAPGVFFLLCFVRHRYNLSDFQQRKDTCPYFFARSCLDDADVIVFNYQVGCWNAVQCSTYWILRLVL